MTLALYQLGVTGLFASAVIIATFFAVLKRSVPRDEVRWWTYGWAANAVALAMTFFYWYVQPPQQMHPFVFAIFLAAKIAYAWLMVRAVFELNEWRMQRLAPAFVVPWIAGATVVAVLTLTTLDRLGLASQSIVGVAFLFGALAMMREPGKTSVWLMLGYAARGLHASIEALAYGSNVLLSDAGQSAFRVPANRILAMHFSFDTGAEWFVALGCVIVIAQRQQQQLQRANAQMLDAQAHLRRLADRDPLTTLANRRVLPEIFRAVQPRGALLAFFDLDGFKLINDKHGHHAGDDCLVRFAEALAAAFRPGDAVVRYAGDEFVVVAQDIDEAALASRIESLRDQLNSTTAHGLPIRFSHGIARLAPGANPDEALRAADEAMYRDKSAAAL